MKPSDIPVGPDLPPNWTTARHDYEDQDAGVFGHVSYEQNYVTGGRSWWAYCVIAFKDERLDAHYPTAAEGIEAVEAFVRAQLGDAS